MQTVGLTTAIGSALSDRELTALLKPHLIHLAAFLSGVHLSEEFPKCDGAKVEMTNHWPVLLAALLVALSSVQAGESRLEVKQLTTGPDHHFFGYIGHVQNIPWNRSGRYILALRTSVRDHLPRGDEPAQIVLLDTSHDYAAHAAERTRAWNPQQGTMLYWNPQSQERQFLFNDRDERTGHVFCVLAEVQDDGSVKRVREYRFADLPIGNSGVAQRGGRFSAINYGRLANLRAVTGYAGAFDGTQGERHPTNDGVFVVDIATGERKLLASFARLAAELRTTHPEVDRQALFINHTLSSRDDSRVFFFVRGGWDAGGTRVNVPVVMDATGKRLRPLKDFIGGHPEWLDGQKLIGGIGKRQVIYDTESMQVTGTLGDGILFPDPEGDIALSPNGQWLVNGYRQGTKNFYSLLRLSGGAVRSQGFDVTGWIKGDLRVDPAPAWNRKGNQILISALADDAARTRQLFLLTLLTD